MPITLLDDALAQVADRIEALGAASPPKTAAR